MRGWRGRGIQNSLITVTITPAAAITARIVLLACCTILASKSLRIVVSSALTSAMSAFSSALTSAMSAFSSALTSFRSDVSLQFCLDLIQVRCLRDSTMQTLIQHSDDCVCVILLDAASYKRVGRVSRVEQWCFHGVQYSTVSRLLNRVAEQNVENI